MDKLLSDIVKSIVDKPNEVNVVVNDGDDARIFELSVGVSASPKGAHCPSAGLGGLAS